MRKLWREPYREPAGNGFGGDVPKHVIIPAVEMCEPFAKRPFHIYSRTVIHAEVDRIAWLVARLFLAVSVQSLWDLQP